MKNTEAMGPPSKADIAVDFAVNCGHSMSVGVSIPNVLLFMYNGLVGHADQMNDAGSRLYIAGAGAVATYALSEYVAYRRSQRTPAGIIEEPSL